MIEDTRDTAVEPTPKRGSPKVRLALKVAIVLAVGVVGLAVAYGGYVYASTPSVIRNAKPEHYHFRMQILVNGKAENFAESKYQQDYNKDQCSADLPEQPIHVHDNKDQFTHIHWEGMTGGLVMKYYGWNYIGGERDTLGYNLDDLSNIQKVKTHGDYLPQVPDDAKFYVYTGDEKGYKTRDFNDWKNQDLEEFFGVTSNSPAHEINKNGGKQASVLDMLFPTAYAHGTPNDSDGDDGSESEEEKLTRINNLIGNVVIFAQKDAPSDEQIKARFNNLKPLSDSSCGG